MTLRALFAIPIGVILLVTLSLAGMIVSREWSGHTRGFLAISATRRADVLTRLEGQLSRERAVTWRAFEADYPLPKPMARDLAATREETNREIDAMIALSLSGAEGEATVPESFLRDIRGSLASARDSSDALLGVAPPKRSHDALTAVMPRMLGPSLLFGPRLAGAASDVVDAEPKLAGIVAVARIGLELRDELVAISTVMLPRINAREMPSAADVGRVRTLLAQADVTTRLLEVTFYLATPTDEMRVLLARANATREATIQRQLDKMIDAGPPDAQPDRPVVWLSWPIEQWADRVNALRVAIVQETVERARIEQISRTQRLNIALTAIGAVALIILCALIVLQRRVVGPLAQLGFAITRIAGGDRRRRFVINSSTREIAAMVTAVETLRQAALIADATVLRQREAADRRLRVLREVLGALRAVYAPSHALAHDIARLSDGFDATIALVGAPLAASPTLTAATTALHRGLREIREAAEDLEATIAAACEAEEDELPEAEIVARILRVRAHIDRGNALVREFVQPCLVALRDVMPSTIGARERKLRELIGDQFQLIEAIVATMASMLATATHAGDMVRELPLPAATATRGAVA
jgi:hypothetical protein